MFSFLAKTDNKILRLSKILLGLCLFLPLLVSSGLLFPYTAPKAFVFRTFVEIAAVFYFYLALKYPAHFFTPLFKGGRWGILNLSVLVFLLVSFLSAIAGIDFYTSFWGNLERMLGIWGLLHFVAWFLMLIGVFRSSRDWYNLLRISVGVSFLVSVLAITQRFFSLGDLLPQTARVYSTIGNASFLGTYLIFNIFFAGYLALSSLRGVPPAVAGGTTRQSHGNQAKRGIASPRSCGARNDTMPFTVYCLLFTVYCLTLFLTGTRGAYLGLLAGVVVFLSLLALAPLFKGGKGGFKEFKKWPIVILAVIFLLSTALFLARDTAFVQNNFILSRLASISFSGATVQSRLILWQDAWRAWLARPLFGWGPENFETALSRYFSPQLAGYEAYSFDRAHNFIFDYGVAGGWLGLIGYLAIFAAAGRAALRKLLPERSGAELKAVAGGIPLNFSMRSPAGGPAQVIKNDFYFSVVFISLLVAYLVQNLFVFDTFISYLMLFFALAMVVSWPLRAAPPRLSGAAQQSNLVEDGNHYGLFRLPHQLLGSRSGSLNNYKKIFLAVAALAIIFSFYSFNLKPILASRLANQILSLPPSETAGAASLLKDALAMNTFASAEVAYLAVIDYINKINQQPALVQNEAFYNVAEDGLQKNIARSPAQLRNYVALAWLNLYFSDRHQERIEQAIVLAQKVKDSSPTKKDAYLILVAAYSMSGQPQKAEETVEAAKMIDGGLGEKVKEYWKKLKQ